MNNEQFIKAIKVVVRDAAISDTIEKLQKPPGSGIRQHEQLSSDWFNGLGDSDKNYVVQIVEDSVDEAIFGFLTVIDGVRAIEPQGNQGRLRLVYEGDEEIILNADNDIDLHDLYNEK